MSIVSGDLSGLGIGPVMQMLERASTSGILMMRSEGSEATFGLRDGKISWAHANFGLRLGEQLVEKGILTVGELALVQRDQARSQGHVTPFGTLIVAMGLAPRDVIARELDEQILRILKEAMTWRNGDYDVSPYRGAAVEPQRRQQRPRSGVISDFLVRASSSA